ncbi:MAG TPA: hypothetical protein VFC35_00170 [Gemmatimonadaceae bacterium]|jgi:hypothetical protein|nr:hypothetical protein [Gemmatimonadaceae bacterium]
MAEQKSGASESNPEREKEYHAPAIEEVVSREGLEREVAYAGVQGPSQLSN